MSKKTMLLALAAISVTLVALPGTASAQEIHLEGVVSYSGTFGATTFSAEGEPKMTCESGHVTGYLAAGGTTGTFAVDFTGCHTTVFGFTAKCHTTGSEKDNTIETGGTFHLITTGSGPAMLLTFETTTMTCAGISNTIIHGDLIGTITSPACNTSSSLMTVAFGATGTVQDHTLYTGTAHDLTATTGSGGAAKTAALVTTTTVTSSESGVLNCT